MSGTRARTAAALLLAAVVAACGTTPPSSTARGQATAGSIPSATGSAAATVNPTATSGTSGPSIDRYADGIPKAIDGDPVLRAAAALAKAAAATDATPFLVGGWVIYWPGARHCPAMLGDQPWSRDCAQAAFSCGSLNVCVGDVSLGPAPPSPAGSPCDCAP